MKKITLDVFRGQEGEGQIEQYDVELDEGMVLLDCIHRIQHEQESDLSCRWNCKAGKCGSCSAEINGKPKLMCMTRMDDLLEETPEGTNISVRPMQTFPHVKDLVSDVTWNYEQAEKVVPIRGPEPMDWQFTQFEAKRAQEFRMCIECFICQDTCHVLREYRKFDEFGGPRTMVRLANFEMHPMDLEDRIPEVKHDFGIGYCNITKCCTDVCPAGINITDNAIIPLKERVVDRYYDPIKRIWRKLTGKKLRMEPHSARDNSTSVAPATELLVTDELKSLVNYLKETNITVLDFFQSIDLDSSGSLDPFEIREALAKAEIADLPPWDVDKLVKAMDINADGKIDLPELEIHLMRLENR